MKVNLSRETRKKAGKTFLVVILLVAIITPTILFLRERQQNTKQAEANAITQAFALNYGKDTQLIGVNKPSDFYLVYRKNGDEIHASLLIGGLWVELGIVTQQPVK